MDWTRREQPEVPSDCRKHHTGTDLNQPTRPLVWHQELPTCRAMAERSVEKNLKFPHVPNGEQILGKLDRLLAEN